MALTTADSGTATTGSPPTGDTALGSGAQTTAGVYVAMWNLTNMAKLDVIRLWVINKVLTGDTAEIVFEGVYANAMGDSPIIQSPPIVSMFSTRMYYSQTAGASFSMPWAFIRIAT
jgi:hypothetical protein